VPCGGEREYTWNKERKNYTRAAILLCASCVRSEAVGTVSTDSNPSRSVVASHARKEKSCFCQLSTTSWMLLLKLITQRSSCSLPNPHLTLQPCNLSLDNLNLPLHNPITSRTLLQSLPTNIVIQSQLLSQHLLPVPQPRAVISQVRGVSGQSTLHGGRVNGLSCLQGEDAQFGIEPSGDGGEVGCAGGGVSGQCAVRVQFEVSDQGREVGGVSAEEGGEGV
jgi:hypothetical protein